MHIGNTHWLRNKHIENKFNYILQTLLCSHNCKLCQTMFISLPMNHLRKTKVRDGPKNHVMTDHIHSWSHLSSAQITVLTYHGLGDWATDVFAYFSSSPTASINN